LASVKSADVLHIATHAEFNTSDPTQSFLELAGSEVVDKLTVQEIFGIGNSLDLVILSACETGVGEISSGDEIISMHRAFSVAGAKSVVSNLWRINDVTSAVVMKRFYRALAEGREKDDALRIAQEVARSHFEHPAYWASFRLVGGYQ
jgi:CHAT domain-containing protein